MTKQIIRTIAVCAAGLMLSASAQNSSTSQSGSTTDQSTGQSTSQSSQSGLGSSDSSSGARHYGYGRMGHQETRASKLMNAEVKSSQGQTLGTINDIVVNPASGRVDFAVLSTSGASASGSSATSTSSATTTTSTDTSSSSGKLVAVPFMLLRPASSSAGISSSAATEQQPSFTFAGDASKLQSAPSFDQSNWPDISQYSWKQSIYSHFGMTPGSSSSTGAATSPGGSDTGTSSGSSSSSSTPPSPSSSDSSSGTSK